MAKKRYQVIRATTKPLDNVTIDGRSMDIPANRGAFEVSDPGLAREVDARFGVKGEVTPGDVVVVPINEAPDPIHRRTFTVPELPWKKRGQER